MCRVQTSRITLDEFQVEVMKRPGTNLPSRDHCPHVDGVSDSTLQTMDCMEPADGNTCVCVIINLKTQQCPQWSNEKPPGGFAARCLLQNTQPAELTQTLPVKCVGSAGCVGFIRHAISCRSTNFHSEVGVFYCLSFAGDDTNFPRWSSCKQIQQPNL